MASESEQAEQATLPSLSARTHGRREGPRVYARTARGLTRGPHTAPVPGRRIRPVCHPATAENRWHKTSRDAFHISEYSSVERRLTDSDCQSVYVCVSPCQSVPVRVQRSLRSHSRPAQARETQRIREASAPHGTRAPLRPAPAVRERLGGTGAWRLPPTPLAGSRRGVATRPSDTA